MNSRTPRPPEMSGLRPIVALSCVLLGLLSGCESSNCLQAIVPSMTVTVVDKVTSENLAEIATGSIQQGGRTEAFERAGDVFVAGSNWPGTFEVEANAPGYKPHTVTVVVPEHTCTVISQEIRIELEPET